ncbi:nucleoside/nucleotide kinase family protein [Yersinia alsatica]|uniref:nucleoside/nucleotide kinase family protein n=1 Tax=Yersinia alsatica TaxID=2890317 RepID=UPI0011AA3F81|nr:nucleoside/nucleotide kinase family protein [Yersinia alsatica]
MRVELNINGLQNSAHFPDRDITQLHLPLLVSLSQQQQQLQRRMVVFLCAPPGTGKSTLATFWQWLSQQDTTLTSVQCLPMDGFHYYNHYLDAHLLRTKKGAPETFDLPKLHQAIQRLQQTGATWPTYDRQLHDPVEDAIVVEAPIIVLEGNWLLLQQPGWQRLKALADYTIFISAAPELLRDRLIERKIRGGLSPRQAEDFYLATDGPNVLKVLQLSQQADCQLVMESDMSYRRA